MQKIILMVTGLLFSLNIFAQTTHDKILGKWTNEDKTRIIEFVKSGDAYDAIIRKAEDNSIVGKKQITALKATGTTSFADGTLHIIKKGKTAKCTASLSGDTMLYIKASHGMMSKTLTWTKL
ncbi:MAG: hypothetical protein K0R77_334 [Chryseobacterium sp.]|jgi:uncharacterized protein (DUF2147 family)|uniref:DUF2147 domain-containing protein n=1 Tax=Chryseobacterium sp. TaxID=1871047 RepID=UPI002631F098|nr:DUF2147 domain-containing protein [Chryseobacterium sp.]MDF2551059.1 hypothetical protein [Chryseobacterium sp.]